MTDPEISAVARALSRLAAGKPRRAHSINWSPEETWEDKNSGDKRTKLVVMVESLVLLGGNRSDGSAPKAPAKEPPPDNASAARSGTVADDDVPF